MMKFLFKYLLSGNYSFAKRWVNKKTSQQIYEFTTGTWDAHTFVNGALLVVGIAAVSFGAIPIVTGVAIYGLLDLVFDVGGGIDSLIGRDSGLWDNKPIESYPTELSPLFNTVQVDNTYLDLPRIEPLKYKD